MAENTRTPQSLKGGYRDIFYYAMSCWHQWRRMDLRVHGCWKHNIEGSCHRILYTVQVFEKLKNRKWNINNYNEMSGRCGGTVREQARVVSIFGGFVTLVSSGSFITTHGSPAHTKIPPSRHRRAQEVWMWGLVWPDSWKMMDFNVLILWEKNSGEKINCF